ncbi:cytochrome P450 [Aspergillus costaricaensis CBS 115574]|uniref:Cytochrome P450 n=1 Tax=Aspergillus costaricaensis CBS 115574 TaxID=1448317 RepID=A0ACD1IVT2_9EURO|nr:cytochrome P450 [Aspergillus costaricaensis CBS 115574]RAK94412.1 cytochrome P450 [Aspergillus costaricaensis CBS 115574]
MSIVIAVAFACLILLSLYLFIYQQSPSLPLPPGPKGKPIVGNLSDLPPPNTPEWRHWMKHRERYGPITSVTILGQPIIILHDAHILATELLEKRSLKYSSRPRSVFLGEMIGWNDTLAMQPYNTRVRLYRKALHQILGTKTLVSKFNSLQELEARRLLLRMIDDPREWVQHLKTEAGAIILKIGYGYDINPHGRDHLVDLADDSMETFSAVLNQTWLVDLVPCLRYLPSWLPFSFHKKAQYWHTQLLTTIETPYRMVKEQMVSGIAPPSYLRNLLQEEDTKKEKSLSAEEKFTAKWTAGSLYLAGADTTVSTLTTFVLSMALNPHVQAKAQAELDNILGPYTLPKLSDREKLPYVNAIVKESLRWYPVAPMGLPHLCVEGDVAITHDPSIYPHPEKFDPERFLGEKPQPDPSGWVFGFGRRVCPGRVLADASIFVTVGMILSALRISLEGGRGEVRFTPGVVSHPVLDGVRLQARSQRHEGVIREV